MLVSHMVAWSSCKTHSFRFVCLGAVWSLHLWMWSLTAQYVSASSHAQSSFAHWLASGKVNFSLMHQNISWISRTWISGLTAAWCYQVGLTPVFISVSCSPLVHNKYFWVCFWPTTWSEPIIIPLAGKPVLWARTGHTRVIVCTRVYILQKRQMRTKYQTRFYSGLDLA